MRCIFLVGQGNMGFKSKPLLGIKVLILMTIDIYYSLPVDSPFEGGNKRIY